LAAAVLPRLAPYAAQNAMIGTATSLGSAARAVGSLNALLGNDDEAVAFLTQACAHNEQMRARPWLALSQYELMKLYGRRGRNEEASALRESVRSCAEALTMEPLLEQLDAATVSSVSTPARAPALRTATFR